MLDYLFATVTNVDFDAEFHQLGGLRGRPDRMVGSSYDVKYSHFDARWRASQRWVDSRMCS